MKARRVLAVLLVVVMLLSVAVSMGQAQGPGAEPVNEAGVELAEGTVSEVISIQGRLTDNHGVPLNGHYTIRFSLYESLSGGTAVCFDTDVVSVRNGLFSTHINFCHDNDIYGKQLYLGIKVGSDPEMSPRQGIYPVPYARSLKPGSHISGSVTSSPYAALHVWNTATTGSAYGIKGGTSSSSGVGVFGDAVNGGTGVYAGSDTGAALKAGGTGVIQSSARSYLFVPGNVVVKNSTSDTTRWNMAGGSVRIYRGSSSGSKYVRIPITIPAVLYGQRVRVTHVKVYYRCANGSHNYITQTRLYKMTSASTWGYLVDSSADRKSNTASAYELATSSSSNLLSADQGVLSLRLFLHFENDTEYVQIGGVRLTLEHD